MKQKVQVTGTFKTRREADLAVEQLVQEHGLVANDIDVHATGAHNSAGTEASGADVESGHPGVEKDGAAKLEGPVRVSVGCSDESTEMVRKVLREAGME